ncbi:MAG: divergent polysaccharide deacetylase family protein [Psychromonas sp.]|nr:divergent polysaccharide deacetylase family protein [Psychromonas sp.]
MKKRLTILIVTLFIVLQSVNSFAKQPVQLAIVLDDVGNSQHDLLALQLPTAITFSILPYTPHAKNIASLAIAQERELLLHVPMQAKANNEKLGKGALMLNMQELAFKAELNKALYYLPDATGINNHMGSALTEHVKQMQWTMEVLNKQGLYFLDSRTTAETIAESTAQISGTPALRRHVFLDNIKTEMAMEKQLQHAVNLGKKQYSVVIIAHPYPETIYFLSKKFKQKRSDVELVSLQELLPQNARLAMAKKRSELQQAHNAVNDRSKQTQ